MKNVDGWAVNGDECYRMKKVHCFVAHQEKLSDFSQANLMNCCQCLP